jgi:hypothetical protein
MRKVRDSSGVLTVVVGAVMAVMGLIGLLAGDWFSAAVLGSLAGASFAADLVLRRRSGRPAAVDLFLIGLIFAIFVWFFGHNHDWWLAAASGAIAVSTWTLSDVSFRRFLRNRSNGSPTSP